MEEEDHLVARPQRREVALMRLTSDATSVKNSGLSADRRSAHSMAQPTINARASASDGMWRLTVVALPPRPPCSDVVSMICRCGARK